MAVRTIRPPQKLLPAREHIVELVQQGQVPSMAVAVAREGRIVWQEAFGLADRENGIAATPDTPYPLASLSKPLTTTGLMVLVEDGAVDLKAPINQYLGPAKITAAVGDTALATVERVACHTAGLGLYEQAYYDGKDSRPATLEETIRDYGILVSPPGARFQYSNLGYGLLGGAIAQASEKSYGVFMQEAVSAPLGMDSTCVGVIGLGQKAHAVKYGSSGAVVPHSRSSCQAASAIYGSAHDLIRFALFQLQTPLRDQSPIISQTGLGRMHQPSAETGPTRPWEQQGSGYGLGWHIGVIPEGLRVVQHSGGSLGVATSLALVPEQDLAVVVLANCDGPWADLVLIEVLCAVLDIDPEPFIRPDDNGDHPTENTLPVSLTGHWEGTIRTPDGKADVTLDLAADGTVRARIGDSPLATMTQVAYGPSRAHMLNDGQGPYLSGRLSCDLVTADIIRGQPCKLWLELLLREDRLEGVAVAFSQRDLYTGPLSHWTSLERVE